MLDLYDLKNIKKISEKLKNIKKVLHEQVKRQDILDFVNELYAEFDYNNFSINKDELKLTKFNNAVNPTSFTINFIPYIESPEQIIISYKLPAKQEETYYIKFCENRTFITKKESSTFGKIKTTTEWEYLEGCLIRETKYKSSKGLCCEEIIENHEAYYDQAWNMVLRKKEIILRGKNYEQQNNYECQSFIEPINIDSKLNNKNSRFHDGISYLNMSSSLFQDSTKQHYEQTIKGMIKRKVL